MVFVFVVVVVVNGICRYFGVSYYYYLFIARANQTLDGHTMRAIINLGDTTNLFANKFNSSTFLAFILSQPSLFVLCFYIALFSHRFIHWYIIPQMMMIPVAIEMASADRR